MISRALILAGFTSLLITSCFTFAPTPTSTPTKTLTATLIPTTTPLPTATLTSTATPAPPTETPDALAALLPSGVPDKEWNGIPIMPEAINGNEVEKGYSFTTKASARAIQAFYQSQLGRQGFNLLAAGMQSGSDTLLLIFTNGQQTISISIFPHTDELLVLITE